MDDERPPVDGPGDEDGPGTTLQFPSADFPALSTFRLRAPEGWSAIATADAVLGIRRDGPTNGGFRPNVLVNVHRLPRTGEPDRDLDRLLDGDHTLPAFEVVEDEQRSGDAPARWRRIAFLGPEGRSLVARRLMILVPVSEHYVDVVSAIGTWPSDGPSDVERDVESIVGSLQVGR